MTRIVCVALATIAGTVGCRGSEAARQQLSLQVLAAAPGMSASDVELYVTRPLEVGLSGIAGEVGVRSTSEAGQARVELEFGAAVDELAARQQVIAKLQAVQLPSGIQPMIGRSSQDHVVMRYLVRGPVLAARTFADWELERAMRTIPGVVDADSRGGLVEELRVTLDRRACIAHGVTPADVRTAIVGAEVPQVGSQPVAFSVRGSGLHGEDDIRKVIVKRTSDDPVRVGDVAVVERVGAPWTCLVVDQRGDSVVEGVVWARPGVEVASVRDAIGAKLADMAKAAPAGLAIEPLALDRETRVDVPADGYVEVGPLARMLPAGATPGEAVIERCRELPLDREVPDEVVVMSSSERAAPVLTAANGARVVPSDPAPWVRIIGSDLGKLAELTDAVVAAATKLGVTVTTRVGTATIPQLAMTPDRAALARYDLDSGDVEMLFRLATGEVEIANAYEGARMLAITLRVEVPSQDPRSLAALAVARSDDSIASFGQLATFRHDASPRAILRANGQRYTALRVHPHDDDARRALQRALDQIAVPDGYRISMSDRMAPTDAPSGQPAARAAR